MMHTLRVLFCTTEAAPFAKTGGMGDVAGALPLALKRNNVDAAIMMPLYSETIRNQYGLTLLKDKLTIKVGATPETFSIYHTQHHGVDCYFLRCDFLFYRKGLYTENGEDYLDNPRRFAYFSAACIAAMDVLALTPDIIHVHDWQASLIPVFLHDRGTAQPRTLLTIHNLAYQGLFPVECFHSTGLDWSYFHWRRLEFYNQVNYLKGGINFADAVSTVSPTYAREIQRHENGCGLDGVLSDKKDRLYGILNGIDQAEWNPRTDPLIPAHYHLKDLRGKARCRARMFQETGLRKTDKPLFGVVTRLTEQKGLDILIPAMGTYLKKGFPFVVLGTGDPKYENQLAELAQAFPGQLSLSLTFDNAMAHRIEAASDIFLMPSRFEPCGLNQMYSMIYGTVPIVRSIGGLADSVLPVLPDKSANADSTGFTFHTYDAEVLENAMQEAIKAFDNKPFWHKLMRNGMKQDFKWDHSAGQYKDLYSSLLTPDGGVPAHKTGALQS